VEPRSIFFLLSASRLFVDFCDGWKVGTTCGCEILFSVSEMAGKTFVMLETAYREAALGENTSLRVGFPLQEW
jgi:hypothetical protein